MDRIFLTWDPKLSAYRVVGVEDAHTDGVVELDGSEWWTAEEAEDLVGPGLVITGGPLA